MSAIKEFISHKVGMWEELGHPAILERFVRDKGETHEPDMRQPWTGDWGVPNECFKNATHEVLSNRNLRYVEGFIWSGDLPILIHHAWVLHADGRWADPTLREPERYSYYGVVFDSGTLMTEMNRTGVYGLLDTGVGINADLIFRQAPYLEEPVMGWTAKQKEINDAEHAQQASA